MTDFQQVRFWAPIIANIHSSKKGELDPVELLRPLRWKPRERVVIDVDIFHEAKHFPDIAAVFGVMASTMHDFVLHNKSPIIMKCFHDWIVRGECDAWTECHAYALERDDEEESLHCGRGPGYDDSNDRSWPLKNVSYVETNALGRVVSFSGESSQ